MPTDEQIVSKCPGEKKVLIIFKFIVQGQSKIKTIMRDEHLEKCNMNK